MTPRLHNKIAIILGASKGIGRGIAKVFAAQGAKVIITGRCQDSLESVIKEMANQQQEAHFIVGDVTCEKDMNNIVDKAMALYGRIDIICMNAGIYPQGWLGKMTLAQWNEVISTNLSSVFLATQACLPIMKKQQYGRIVITSSISGPQVGLPGYSHYTASKAGITGFIKTAAIELAKDNITINAVEPGNIMTEGFDEMGSEHKERMLKAIPLRRLGTVEDVGYATLFLASDEAQFITGQTIVVDGGQILPESVFLPFNE